MNETAQPAVQSQATDPRTHLFVALAWSTTGFAAVALLSLVLAGAAGHLLSDLDLGAAGACVGAGFVGFAAVAWCASQIDAHDTKRGHLLLWTTTLVYSGLVNVFAAAIDFGETEGGVSALETVAGAVGATGGAIVIMLGVAVAIGFDARWKRPARWVAIVALTTVAVEIAAPGWWLGGIIGGLLLARAADLFVLYVVHERAFAPPALAACLVASVTALVLLVIYFVIRDAIRIALEAIAHGTKR